MLKNYAKPFPKSGSFFWFFVVVVVVFWVFFVFLLFFGGVGWWGWGWGVFVCFLLLQFNAVNKYGITNHTMIPMR